MTDRRAHTLSSRQAFTGRIFGVVVDQVRTPGGRDVALEIVRHPRSVVLMPMPDADRIVLVRQYRYAIDRWIWELPAGTLEPGEDPDQAARRECTEEIGLFPDRVERLSSFFPTPGYCDEEMIFYRLTGLRPPPTPPRRDEDEDLEPQIFTIAKARALVESGEIVDMKTVVGLNLV